MRKKPFDIYMKIFCYISILLVGLLSFSLVSYVLVKGAKNISWQLLSTSPSYLEERIGILPDIVNTIYLVIRL